MILVIFLLTTILFLMIYNALKENDGPIAIVGMACKFPGDVNNPKDLWELLLNKRDGIIDTPSERWDVVSFKTSNSFDSQKMQIRKGGFIKDIDQFCPLMA